MAAKKCSKTKLRVHCLEKLKVRIVFIPLQDVLELTMEKFNWYIALNGFGRSSFTMSNVIRQIVVIFSSSLCAITMKKAVEELVLWKCNSFRKRQKKFTENSILALSFKKHLNESGDAWSSQRDVTRLSAAFVEASYEMSKNICLSPNHALVSIDDEL